MTLLEVVIGAALSIVLTLAAFTFSQHQSRVMGLSSTSLNMGQAGRTAIDLLADDIRHAGVGIGYRPDGSFPGVILGEFTFGAARFATSGMTVPLASGEISTDDLGFRLADGNYATVADWSTSGTAQICAGSGVRSGELSVVRTEDGLAFKTISITALTSGAGCTTGLCLGGCDTLVWSDDTSLESEDDATSMSFLGGELATGYKSVVWFVEATDPSREGIAALRRVMFDGTRECGQRDYTCGDLVAEGIETLQAQFWEWDPGNDRWNNVTGGTTTPWSRLRVDVELVVRGMSTGDRPQGMHELRLEPGVCVPSCDTPDGIERRVLRASTEIKNSGRARIR